MNHLFLSKVQDSKELPKILNIQKAAFEKLYFKYKDEKTSPYKDSLQDIERRFNMQHSRYYFIQAEDTTIGFIRMITNAPLTKGRISPIAILPQFENKGYGKRTMFEIESLFPNIKEWELDTIKQETHLVDFYTKLGYVKLDKEEQISDNIHLAYFRKKL